jgi:hypothetical protein
MIIVKISSGLGNQLFQYAASKALSIRMSAELKLDLSFYKNDKKRKYRLDKFRIDQNIATEEDTQVFILTLKQKNFFKRKFLDHFNISGLEKYNNIYVKERPLISYAQGIENLNGSVYLEGYWQNQRYFININDVLQKEVTLKDPLPKGITEIISEISSCNSVSVHIRRGDYLNNEIFYPLPLYYYEEGFSLIKKLVLKPIFFVFSDDIGWAKMNFKSELSTVFVEINDKNKDLYEFEIMKNCRHNIIANSSYSWWSAWLNNNVDKIVVAPKRWSINNKFQKNLDKDCFLPQEWIRL